MTKREAVKAAQADVKAGKDRHQVFEAYKGEFARPIQLAAVISGVAKEEEKRKAKGMNLALVVLLVVAGILKFLGVLGALWPTHVALALGLALVSLLIPFGFAYEINRFNGALYGILTFLAGLGIVNVALRIADGPIEALVDILLLAAILALSLNLRKKLFPGLGLLGPKKDNAGAYLLG
jgi:hypothetical protein